MGGAGLSTGAIVGIALGCGAVLGFLIVTICIIRSRSLRKQRKFQHGYRGTIRYDQNATLTNLSRFSNKVEKIPHKESVHIIGCAPDYHQPDPRYVSMALSNNPPPTCQARQQHYKEDWQLPETHSSGQKRQRHDKEIWQLHAPKNPPLKPPVLLDEHTGKRSPLLLRANRPPRPLPRNIYTEVPRRESSLYRSNSDCLSVISYDLGDPRNSTAMKRHSSLYFPTSVHRLRTDTASTTRSSGMAMDLGDGTQKAWMMLDNDYFRKHSITHL